MRYVASIHGDNEPGFGIGFPDFPGCVSDGGTVEEAIRRGREALAFHIESMAEDGEDIPRPRALRDRGGSPYGGVAPGRAAYRLCRCRRRSAPAIAPAADPLVRRVGEIFGRRLARFVNSSAVPDLLGGDRGGVKVVLLLESPYKKEVRRGCPLAGASGKTVTEELGRNVPAMCGVSGSFGRLVATGGDARVSKFGIMNASRLPLDADAYRESGADHRTDLPAWSEFERCLRYVRRDERPVTERNEAALLMERAIAQDLQERLDGIPVGNDVLLVCCGAVAQGIFERTHVRDGVRIAYAPHPSRGGWGQKKNIECMRGVYDGIAHAIR